MAELSPYPFGALTRRMFRELERKQSIFDLPARKFVLGEVGKDFSVRHHGLAAATPFGPAAGPNSQLAQNIVLSWLAGGRIIELKTVQINDRLTIPRPCIDMQTVGYNVEWSQELLLEQSLEEYVKGAMLIRMLEASGALALAPGFGRTVYDMSVGYDLAGIKSERVQAFIRGMMDATALVDRLRREIPDEFKQLRDLDFETSLSSTLTLSTFHGCPPDEIERIIDYLLRQVGLSCVIKLNPMLLGKAEARRLLNDELGYTDLRIPDSAFDRDTTWEQAVGFVGRLGATASSLGLGLGVKFSNTLIVENHRDFFPKAEAVMYLSGQPLHVLAMHLVRRFRREFGDRYPISFSAGIERANFPDAVALGLVPITVCSDLLRPGGYGRPHGYFEELARRMDAVGANSVDGFVLRAYQASRGGKPSRAGGEVIRSYDLEHRAETGHPRPAGLSSAPHAPEGGEAPAGSDRTSGAEAEVKRSYEPGSGAEHAHSREGVSRESAPVSEARLRNTEYYVEKVTGDKRYTAARNAKPPRKIGSTLKLFDCITCDKCVPVCPNDANFTFALAQAEIPIIKLRREGSSWTHRRDGSLAINEKHQIGNFADFCNDCGNCDVFCPEDGGPYVLKPRFFVSRDRWKGDGFLIETGVISGRFNGAEYRLETAEGTARYSGPGFAVVFEEQDPLATVQGDASAEVDLTYFHIMNLLRAAILAPSEVNYVNCW